MAMADAKPTSSNLVDLLVDKLSDEKILAAAEQRRNDVGAQRCNKGQRRCPPRSPAPIVEDRRARKRAKEWAPERFSPRSTSGPVDPVHGRHRA